VPEIIHIGSHRSKTKQWHFLDTQCADDR